MSRFQYLILTAFLLSCVEGAPVNTNEVSSSRNGTLLYQLYTRENPITPQILTVGDVDALKNSNYDPNKLVKLYAPGWGNNGSIAYPTRDGYLLREDCNVFLLDWRAVQVVNYTKGFNITVDAGRTTGAFVNFLIDNGTPRNSIYLIGHSAGCHIVGVAGSTVSSGKLPRITGLDPAFMTDHENETENILDITDADFVDIVHTNGGNGTDVNEIAITDPAGHIDFYVNGGHHQPGCDIPGHCDHIRAGALFTESINSKMGFWARRCDTFEHFQEGMCHNNDAEIMGDLTPSSSRGVFHLTTNAESPFAQKLKN